MTRDDIIRLAREAGFVLSDSATDEAIDRFWAFYNLAAAAEREACAKVCDEREYANVYGFRECAAAIRARGQA